MKSKKIRAIVRIVIIPIYLIAAVTVAHGYTYQDSPCKHLIYVRHSDATNSANDPFTFDSVNGYIQGGSTYHLAGSMVAGYTLKATVYYWTGTNWGTTIYSNWSGILHQHDYSAVATPTKLIESASIVLSSNTQAAQWIATQQCVDCTDQYTLKVMECGSAEMIENWDPATCTGNCYCEETPTDNPNTYTYKTLEDFCGGPGHVKYYSTESCNGECEGCDAEYQAAITRCAEDGGKDVNPVPTDAAKCEYECVNNCETELTAIAENCGFWGIDKNTINLETCTADCNQDCSGQYDALTDKCGILGIASFDNSSCTGKCKDCDYWANDCSDKCGGYGDAVCTQAVSNGMFLGIEIGACTCKPPDEVIPSSMTATEGEPFGVPGTLGGDLTYNPDGTVTETLSNGTKITYSADSKSITVVGENGQTTTAEQNEDGSITYGTTSDGEHWKFKTVVKDSSGNVTEVTEWEATDVNADNPELDANLVVVPGSETTTVYTTPNNSGIPTTTTEDTNDDDTTTYPSLPSDESEPADYTTVDWTGVQNAFSTIGDKIPISAILTKINPFGSVSTDAPTLSYNVPTVTVMGHEWYVLGTDRLEWDLDPLDPIVTLLRWGLAILSSIYAFRWIYKVYGGA